MSDPNKTACFAGHRIIYEPSEEIKKRLYTAVSDCVKDGVIHFIAGGAIGFDMLAEKIVLELKDEGLPVTLTLALPCPPNEQTARWNESCQTTYAEILSRADEVILVSPCYTKSCMLKRDRFMVDHSEKLICYLRKECGGTFYTLNYALKSGKTILPI
ncbi:MAG: DUF1273 domain-containing protein [Bacteroides sp.]|nr:DUF1273 domain-containing protein [Eubacterium sp.]MCM1419333.1 DUF1273 domain-containing protein [Roseburia sp.]MCM1462027.1 DUF1273 domain-containing protein [Bacteroides sp.]